MRTSRLIGYLALGVALALPLSSTDAQQRPAPEGAWDACTAWVARQLHQPAGLRFPELDSASVDIRITGRRYRPDYLIRSFAMLPRQAGPAERLPFSCVIQFRVTGFDSSLGYVWKRLVLPDSTVALPPTGSVRGRQPRTASEPGHDGPA